MKLEKKHIILASAVLVLIIVLVYRMLNPFKQQEVYILTYGADTGSVTQKNKTDSVGLSDKKNENIGFAKAVDRYFTENKHSGVAHKNLFAAGAKFVEKQSVPPLKKPVKKVVSPVVKPPEIQKDPVQEAKANLTKYQFYGSYEVGGTRAVFLGKNKMILVARAGDRIDGKYLIDKIDAKEIKIQALDINKTFQLDLKEFRNQDDE
ncbi:MAG: hypothetical protein HUN04_13980 [Desulfobacter sp.]|nr:MAG: hypothetical protein HUN04_13980 [Desulfobacter sp.]